MAETLSYDNTPDTEVLTSEEQDSLEVGEKLCLLYTSPSPRDVEESRMPSSA